MRVSDSGIAFIREREGCKLAAYLDGGGVPTIGVGHIKGVKMGQTITQFEADEMLKMDLEDHDISALLKVPTKQNEFDALSSLAFNIGVNAFAGSTVLKRHNLGNRMGAANAFLMWVKDNGRTVDGLMRRREAERKLYLS
jgi:lysozyme